MYVVMELFNFVELSWLDEMALRNVASNAVVSSLFDGISTRRIVHPLLDARSGTNVVDIVVDHPIIENIVVLLSPNL